ncbi:hypothetical protein ECE50_018735 [Chitinophaga sp. Mgbs1]|uniref:Transporter n=1 Tax=Chitinophaga solisilvae TaxID=1233460 RepID=A0A9Q5D9C9_9BACT|nr:hypothetical protein [Chitinophaga solisilvae]
MKKLFFIMAILMPAGVFACDICGCSASGYQLGILPQYHKNFIGLRYGYRQFRSTHPTELGNTMNHESREFYHTTELWGRWYATKRLQLFAFVPFQYFKREEGKSITTVSGLGDITLMANYTFLDNNWDLSRKWHHVFQAGGGIKLPTGKTGIPDEGGNIYQNFQPGSRSTDFVVNAVYTMRRGKWGINTDASYRINTANKESYQFGNRFNTSIRGFLYQPVSKTVALQPYAGVMYEHAAGDRQDRKTKDYTGGEMVHTSVGADVYFKRFSAGVQAQLPVYQHLSDGYNHSYARVSATVNFFF